MELFASPMACSLASHITALEAGLPVKVRFVENKKTDDGGDYYTISAKGYVPALRLDDGTVLNEGASVLQYLADRDRVRARRDLQALIEMGISLAAVGPGPSTART